MKLIKGKNLNVNQRAEVLNAYGYRWSIENEGRAKRWHGKGAPTMALESDEKWLNDHAFWFLNDGSRLTHVRNYCVPEYRADDQ